MAASGPDAALRAFQGSGGAGRLLALADTLGRDRETYERVAAALAPVLEPLAHGEHPRCDDLDPAALLPDAEAVEEVLSWAAGSERADLRSGALGAMGALGWDAFGAELAAAARAPAAWERLAAIEALGGSPSPRAGALLQELVTDPDPETRAAARAAFERRGQSS